MKKWQLLISIVAAFVISLSSNVQAASILVSIDNLIAEAPTFIDPDTGHIIVGTLADPRFVLTTAAGDRLEVGGELDPDPFILFSGAVIDAGAPSTFGFTYILPLAPTMPNPSNVQDSLSGSVGNGPAAGGVTVTPAAHPVPVDGDGVAEIQVFTLSDNGGTTWKNVGLDSGLLTTVPLGSNAAGLYGIYNQGPIFSPAGGPWTHMRADINFTLSGGGDRFTFNGAKVLYPGPPGNIPEPGTLLLALLSFGAACVYRRRSVR